jgi:hypothetical protein
MKVLSAGYLFACKLIWSLTRLNGAARPLVRALGSPDDNIRMIAGMFLVQAGPRAIPVLTEAMRKRENLQMVLSVVASVGDKKLEPYVRPFESDGDVNVAAAARHVVQVLSSQN